MKKILLGSVVGSSLLLGMEITPFVGFDIASSKASYDAKTSLNSSTMSLRDINIGFKAGVIKDNQCRIYLNHTSQSDIISGDRYKYSLTALNYDYMFDIENFRPYIGAHLGYSKSKFGTYANETMPDVSSWDGGVNLGVMKEFDDISFELGYRYTYVKATSNLLTNSVFTNQERLKNTQSFFIGMNYKF